MQPRRVVVAGGGIGGLATAALLARTGHDVTLLERSASLRSGGTGIVLRPDGLAVVDALGLVPRLAADGSWLRTLTLHDGRGRPIASLAVPPAEPPLDAALVVPRHLLQDALADVAAAAGAAITTAVEVSDVIQDPDGVTVVAGPGGAGLRADLLVAADGGRSCVRARLGVRSRYTPGAVYVRALAPVDCPPEVAGEHWGRHGPAGLLPCGQGRTSWFASGTDDVRDAVASGLPSAVRAAVCAAHPVLSGAVQELRDVHGLHIDQVHTVRTSRHVDGRVVLLGDAAHAMPPHLGQGANSALVDAAVLALELAARPWQEALRRYDAVRRPAARRAQRVAGRLARAAHRRYGHALRDLVLRTVPAAIGGRAAGGAVDVVRLRDDLAGLLVARGAGT